jgi:hypothetical protein
MRIRRTFFIFGVAAGAMAGSRARAATVPVRFPEGVVHGFLTLSTPDGRVLADGDSIQLARGDRVTNRLVFRFRDGSLQEETTVFLQRRTFELLTDRFVQKGPAFPHPIEIAIDRPGGRVIVKSMGKDGRERTIDRRMELPADLANGLVPTLIKNLPDGVGETTVSYLVATPKPSIVSVGVSREGEDGVRVGASRRTVERWVVRVKLSGIKRTLAKLLGKLPPDTRVWILDRDAPTFLRSEGPAWLGGPMRDIRLTSPEWAKRPLP